MFSRFFKRQPKKPSSTTDPIIRLLKKATVYSLLGTSILLFYSRFQNNELIFTFESNEDNIQTIRACKQLRKGVYYPTYFLPFPLWQYLYSKYVEKPSYLPSKQVANFKNLKELPIHHGHKDSPDTSILLIVSGCKGIDPFVQKAALSANKKGFRTFYYDLQQFMDTSQLHQVTDHLRQHYPTAKIYGMGIEYGANLLVRQATQTNTYRKIVSIANPLDLENQRNIRGLWKYTLQKDLIRQRKKKAGITTTVKSLYDLDQQLYNIKPQELQKFKQTHSSINSIKNLKIPCLLFSSLSDPLSKHDLPHDERIENPYCLFVQTKNAGHQEWYESGKTTHWIFKPALQFLLL